MKSFYDEVNVHNWLLKYEDLEICEALVWRCC